MATLVLKFTKAFSDEDIKKSLINDIKNIGILLVKIAILVGVSYVILSPIIGIIVNSISSDRDAYNPMVYILPQSPTLERYKLVLERLDYFPTMARDLLYTVSLMAIQILVCAMVGYGFARFEFPFK